LDTRSKIMTEEDARRSLQGRPAQWVAGHFDPLLAEHVQLLRRHSAPNHLLVVEITNPARPLLAQRARAELVAALSIVDFVVMKNGEPASEAADASVTGQFIKRVRRRHSAEGTE
jgi:bifunctional ADP-heptose synthase (sugar kinase/adenylyltransferase)